MARQKKQNNATDLKRKRDESPADSPSHCSKVLKALDGLDATDSMDHNTSDDLAEDNVKKVAPVAPVVDSDPLPIADGQLSQPGSTPGTNSASASSANSQSTSSTSISGWDGPLTPEKVFNDLNGWAQQWRLPFTSTDKFTASIPFREKAILPAALVICSTKYGEEYEFHGVVPLNILQVHRPTKALRLLKCAAHPDNTNVKSPQCGIINTALADPASMIVNPDGYLWSRHHKSWVLSTIMGQTTYASSGEIRQICIAPFTHGWHRFTAVLAKVYGHHALLFQSFQGGISFGTSRFPSNGNTKGISAAGKYKKGQVAPIKGSWLGKGQQIPVYDGREGFQLGRYWEHPYSGEVSKGSTVMLLFSVKKGNISGAMNKINNLPEAVKFAIYFNVLGIVVLEEAVEQFSNEPSQEKPEAFGVDGIVKYVEAPVEAEVQAAAEDESEGEELEESIL